MGTKVEKDVNQGVEINSSESDIQVSSANLKEKQPQVLVIIPSECAKLSNSDNYNTTSSTGSGNPYGFSYRSEPFSPDEEQEKISNQTVKDISLKFIKEPSVENIKSFCEKMEPKLIIFYTHAMPNDIFMNDGVRISSDSLNDMFGSLNSKPIIVLGACHSDTMAKIVFDNLQHPVIGFSGQMDPCVLTEFIVGVINSYARCTSIKHTFDDGISGIKMMENTNYCEQYKQAVLYSSTHVGFLSSLKNYLNNLGALNSAALEMSMKKYGLFSRICGENNIAIQNESPVPFIVTVKVKDDPTQLISIAKGGITQVFIGKSEKAFITLYSDCHGEDGYYIHTTIDRNIPTKHTFIIRAKHMHILKTIPIIPEFEFTKKDLQKLLAK